MENKVTMKRDAAIAAMLESEAGILKLLVILRLNLA